MAVRPLQRPRLRTEAPVTTALTQTPLREGELLPKVLARVIDHTPNPVAAKPISASTAPDAILAAGQAINEAVRSVTRDTATAITNEVPWLKSYKVWVAAVLLLAVFGGGNILRNQRGKQPVAATPKAPATTTALAKQEPATATDPVTNDKTAKKPATTTPTTQVANKQPTATLKPGTVKPAFQSTGPVTSANLPANTAPAKAAPNTSATPVYQAQQPTTTAPRTAARSTDPRVSGSEPLPALPGVFPQPITTRAGTSVASRDLPTTTAPNAGAVIYNNTMPATTGPTSSGDARLEGNINAVPLPIRR